MQEFGQIRLGSVHRIWFARRARMSQPSVMPPPHLPVTRRSDAFRGGCRLAGTAAFALLAGALFLAFPANAQKQPEVDIRALSDDSSLDVDMARGEATGTNGVLIRYGGSVLTARSVVFNYQTWDAVADGGVRIQQEDMAWAGEHVVYNIRTRQIETAEFRAGRPPIFASGQGLHAELGSHVFAGTNSYITSDDIADPTVRLRAKYIRISPGDKIEAWHATLWIGGVPVFYFPYYSRVLDRRANNFNIVPGYRSSYGPYLLGTYTWFLNDQLDGVLHADYRERRGPGAGADFNTHLGPWGQATARYYYLNDQEPSLSNTNPVPFENRQRVYFSWLASPVTNLEFRSMARWQSDSTIVRDFFEGEYRQNVQPSSYFEASKFWQNFSLDTYVQPRLNTFLDTVERLPDVRLTGYRQQIGSTPLYYESESSAGYFHRRFAETNGPIPSSYAAARADTFHQITLPWTFFGWLNVTPRVGGRFTYYSETTNTTLASDEIYRGVFNTGAEISFKAWRLWPSAYSQVLDVDGLRHIVEPSVNYVYVPAPNHPPSDLSQFDTEEPSLRLLPIEYPDYNSIDSVDSQNVFRFGLRNKLQTKRHGQVETLLNWNVYTDWRVHPQTNQTTFADIYSDLIFKPRSWLTLESLTRYDVDTRRLRMSFSTLSIEPNNVWNWSLSHWYLRDDFSGTPTSLGQGNDLINSSLFIRLNENWGLRSTHRFDIRDGRMEEQSYSIYRDLRSWTAAVTFRILDNLTGPKDYSFAFTLSLKARPRYPLGTDSVRPYWLLGS
jgi:lipopolysaccharide assembly outer membrane protein LptD (OstA)